MQTKRMAPSLYVALGVAAVLAGGTGLLAANAQRRGSATPEPRCKVSPVEAIHIARNKVSGRPLQANFEFDEGKWVYGVMIVSGKTIKEVEIDPMSGKVGDVETVNPADEAKEIQQDLTKAIGGKVNSKGESGEQNEKDEKP